jgi:GT2 family glycosyltransferase
MQHAHGRFFALLDADDDWDRTFLAEQLRLFRGDAELAVVSGNALNRGGPRDGQPVRPWPAEPRELVFLDLIEHIDSVFIMSVFRREVYEAVGGFNETFFHSEDYEFWLRVAARGFRFWTNPRPLGRYRRREDSASADQRAMFDSIERVLLRAREFRHRPRADELGAIDRQVDRLRGEKLLTLGKAALLRQDFAEAQSHFRELHRRGQGARYAALATALGVAPELVRRAYRLRLERLARRAVAVIPPSAALITTGAQGEAR